ncbi:MAG: cyclic nucleotide-binding domain-containing protein [Myxococcales bacterium]
MNETTGTDKWRLFADLSAQEVEFVLEACQKKVLVAGEELFCENDEGDSLFIVQSGRVEIFKNIRADLDKPLASMGPGEVIGEMSFIDSSRRSAGARTTEPCEFLVLTRSAFQSRIEKDRPTVAARIWRNVAAIMAVRVRNATEPLQGGGGLQPRGHGRQGAHHQGAEHRPEPGHRAPARRQRGAGAGHAARPPPGRLHAGVDGQEPQGHPHPLPRHPAHRGRRPLKRAQDLWAGKRKNGMKRISWQQLVLALALAACSGGPPVVTPPDAEVVCEKPCGTQCCSADQVCGISNTCVDKCQPHCTGRDCGDDGCGGVCGECPTNGTYLCSDQGKCEQCTRQCAGKSCGADGCGGTCGACGTGTTCKSGSCVSCTPQCTGRVCGDDGCGGVCTPGCTIGTCDLASGTCKCQKSCAGKACGDDGCGGQCGTCTGGASCVAGQCEACEPDCGVRKCGDDGCGGLCGLCTGGASCVAGQCQACQPNCGVRKCGDNGCGGSCGSCTAPASCDGSGQCVGPANHAPTIVSVSQSATLTESGLVTISATVSDLDGPGDLSGGLLRDPRTGTTVKPFTGAVGSYSLTLSWSDFSAADLTFGSSGATINLEAIFYDQASASAVKAVPVKLACYTSGKSGCSGTCYDLKTDPSNCGACGVSAPGGGECKNGVPGCATGYSLCGDRCTQLSSDTYNCGSCGKDCNEWAVGLFGEQFRYWGTCVSGLCVATTTTTTRTSCNSYCSSKGLACQEKTSCHTFYSPNYTSFIYAGCADYKQGYNDCLYDQMTLKCSDTPPASVTAERFTGTCNLTQMSCYCSAK